MWKRLDIVKELKIRKITLFRKKLDIRPAAGDAHGNK
jgi:hypothetical protein